MRRESAAGRPVWSTVWPHLLAAAALVLVADALIGGEYVGGGSYSCNAPLEDFGGPRPAEQDTGFFDAGPPCWDEAKSRILTAAVLLPSMIGAWVARSVALASGRPRGPFVAAFALLGLVGFYAGFVGGAG